MTASFSIHRPSPRHETCREASDPPSDGSRVCLPCRRTRNFSLSSSVCLHGSVSPPRRTGWRDPPTHHGDEPSLLSDHSSSKTISYQAALRLCSVGAPHSWLLCLRLPQAMPCCINVMPETLNGKLRYAGRGAVVSPSWGSGLLQRRRTLIVAFLSPSNYIQCHACPREEAGEAHVAT